MKKSGYVVFGLFSLFYLLTASRIALPGIMVLRWVGSALLVVYALKVNGTRVQIPRAYLFIFIALIPTFLGITGEGTLYAYARIISLFLTLFGLEFFLGMRCMTKHNLRILFALYTATAGVLMLYSIANPNMENDRMTGVYTNANFISCVAVFCLTGSLGLLFSESKIYLKIIWGVFAAAGAYCALMSGSRIGLFLLLLVLVSIPVLRQERPTAQAMVTAFVGLVAIILLMRYVASHMDIVALDRFDSFGSKGNGINRGETWSDVLPIFEQRPVFGWGYSAMGYHTFVNNDTSYNWGMHSSIFGLLCEMGIMGTIMFAGFFVSYARGSLKSYQDNRLAMSYRDKVLMRYLVLAVICMFGNSYAESFLFSVGNPMAICFWLPFVMIRQYVIRCKPVATFEARSVS